jgi:CheY-like chemotaxis protein
MEDEMSQVLLVDDDTNLLEALRVMLEASGHTVTTAHNGLEALRIATVTPPQVVVSDIMMPVMDGSDMARRMRWVPWLDEVPIVLMSAQVDTPGVTVEKLLKKPFEPATLLGVLHDLAHDPGPGSGTASHPSAPSPRRKATNRSPPAEAPHPRLVSQEDALLQFDRFELNLRRGLALIREQEERVQRMQRLGAETAMGEELRETMQSSVELLIAFARACV